MPKKNIKISEITEEVLAKTVDLVLVSIFYGLEFGFGGYSRTGKASERAGSDLADLNYDSIKRAILDLKKKGFIQSAHESTALPLITAAGKRRLTATIPVYDQKRTWDGRIYLIIYDLPNRENKQRNKLRQYLKKIGCGLLQESVWITPYNPKAIVGEFVAKTEIDPEYIVISSIGRDGAVGETDVKELMERVFKLSELNERYKEFLSEIEKEDLGKEQIVFNYLSILQDDPQIPFKLLPNGWVGDEAYNLFKKKIEN